MSLSTGKLQTELSRKTAFFPSHSKIKITILCTTGVKLIKTDLSSAASTVSRMKSLMMFSDLLNRKNYNNKMRSQHNMSKIQPALIIKKSKRHLILSTLWLRRDNHGLILILDRQVLQFTFLENNHYPQETTTPGNVLVKYIKMFMCTQMMSGRLTLTRES